MIAGLIVPLSLSFILAEISLVQLDVSCWSYTLPSKCSSSTSLITPEITRGLKLREHENNNNHTQTQRHEPPIPDTHRYTHIIKVRRDHPSARLHVQPARPL
jgi:hypothetical protein